MKTLVQASTLNALMLGNFDETVSVKDFMEGGDTGIGTYAGLDGEAIFENGVAYKATADGKVTVMKPEGGVAFGTVIKFDENVPTVELKNIGDIEAMKAALKPFVEGNQNIFYMIKATGVFETMHVRSCYASEKPYPTPCRRLQKISGSSILKTPAAMLSLFGVRSMSTASTCLAGTSTI